MRLGPTENVVPVPHARAERAFSIIEVIIAMLILTSVLAAGVLAVAGSERASRGATVMQQKTAVAQRAFERAEGDLKAQASCNVNVWSKDTPPSFRPCKIVYDDMRDSHGRRYRATITILPVDDDVDGKGRADATNALTGDSDFQSRDYYQTRVTIEFLDPKAKLGVPAHQRDPYNLDGRLDWALNEQGSLSVNVCGHYRMDRSVSVADCGASTHYGIGKVKVTLTPLGTAANQATAYSVTVGADGRAHVPHVVPPGDYRISAGDSGQFRYYRSSPEYLRVQAGARHEVSVLMAARPGRTRVCYQITNPDKDFGYWVNETNIEWREHRSLVYRHGRLTNIGEQRRCQTSPLPDPLGYSTHLFPARYAFSVQQRPPGSIPKYPGEWGLRVVKVQRDCVGSGPAVNMPAGADGNPVALKNPWTGMYQQLSGDHTICIDFEAYPLQPVPCATPGPPCVLQRTCVSTLPATAPRDPALSSDPCLTGYYDKPATGPFDPCPDGVNSGPLQRTGPPDPIGTYTGPIIAHFGGPKMSTFYGPGYECNFTASGERFDLNKLTASTLTTKGWVKYGAGSCALVRGGKGEVIIKLNDTGSNAHALLDLSPGSTWALGYQLYDNPITDVYIVQTNVLNGQGCAAWFMGDPNAPPKCEMATTSPAGDCDHPYPPQIKDVWMKPEATAGAANAKKLDPLGNSGSSRRAL